MLPPTSEPDGSATYNTSLGPCGTEDLSEMDAMNGAEEELHQVLLSLYERTGRVMGYWPHYFLRDVKSNGGLAVAKKLLRPGKGVTTGFDRLIAFRRADLSVEAIVLEPRFREIFSDAELAEAQKRLAELPPTAFPERVGRAELRPDEVTSDEEFEEGEVERVLVNRYERNPRARALCLRHHGHRCKVCDLDFGDRYGAVGREFIHVHHVVPISFARIRKLNPERDLVPVCPNCHAMLHRRDPPFDVEELQQILRDQAALGPGSSPDGDKAENA